MAIFPAGKSVRIDSPRHLTLRHARRAVTAYKREARRLSKIAAGVPVEAEDEPIVDPLPPGQQKLNSYWAPGLAAGPTHTISVTQTINASGQDLTLEAEQTFTVDAPQFSLPDGSVFSTYPPAGYSDDHRILPHIVLTDPHLPWERLGSPKAGTNAELREKFRLLAAGADEAPVRNRVPWLVIFSFSQDEIRLSPKDLEGFFKNTSSATIKPVKQSSTMTVNMSIDDLWKLTGDVVTPVTDKLNPDPTSRGDFIFVPSDLFTSFFSTFDANNNRVVPSGPDTSQYQYLSHVRTINGSGMALAGVEDTAVFSIVVGNRSGPLDNVTPTTMCSHLVSIEGVEDMKWPSGSQRYVAMCSLYSWNHTVLPPDTLNVPDAFEHLGRTLDVLRAPENIIAPLRTSSNKLRQRIAKRLDDGFTLVKYYTQTGEPTVAFYRSPLVPTYVTGLDNLSQCSNTGIDLQILDKDLGIMDITYSTAWQLGRTMALGDESFTAALGRLRTAIHTPSVSSVKLQTVKEQSENAIRTREELFSDLPNMVKSLAAIHTIGAGGGGGDGVAPPAPVPGEPFFSPGGAKKRWYRKKLGRSDIPDLSFLSPSFEAKYPAAAEKTARHLARSKSSPQDLFDETNDPLSSDWMIVLSWLVDRMFLAGIPAHYLVADPTYLEEESLRFFRIDNYWIDALIDGATSLGNHSIIDDDRVAIKKALNDYINHVPVGMDHAIQIPAYGFYMRSDLVTMFPDLRVEVLADDAALKALGEDPPGGAPLLRHEIVTDGVMMGLMDRLPGSAQFGSLVFTQPAHQQRFAVARGLDTAQVKVDMRRQYTVSQEIREKDDQRHDPVKSNIVYTPTGDQSNDNIFIWGSKPGQGLNDLRILRLPKFADLQLQILLAGMGEYVDGETKKPYFYDDASTSALLSMQLNDPIYNLTIDLSPHTTDAKLADLAPPKSVPTEVRTLMRLTPARVETTDIDYSQGDNDSGIGSSPPAGDSSDDSEDATFQRHPNYIPSSTALSKNLAPHVRAMRQLSIADLPIPAMRGDGPAQPPKYNIVVSSNHGKDFNIIVLEEYNLQQDLIFSVLVDQNPGNQYLLVEMDIEIELGPQPTQPNDLNYLMPNYKGPGAIMLTNLRFNILPQLLINDAGKSVLRLRLLPRAAKGWIDTTAVSELGFLLGLASINGTNQPFYQVQVQSWAIYCLDVEDPKTGEGNTYRIDNGSTTVSVFAE